MKKRRIIVLVISIFGVIGILMSTSYAVLFKVNETDEQAYTTGILEITSEATNGSVSLINSLPMSDDDGSNLTPYTFRITNVGNLTYSFDVMFLSTTTENQISSNYIKVKVNDGEIVRLNNLTDGIILSDKTLNPGQSVDITLRVWLDEYTPNTELGKVFTGKVTTTGQAVHTEKDYTGERVYNMVRDKSVMDNVSSKFVLDPGGVDFYNISSDINGKGVYVLSDTASRDFPTYYYRGNVDNNNIIFANFCWKIIRTTDTGGTKLIYNGAPVDGKCDNTGAGTFTHLGQSFGNGNDGLSSGGYSFTEQSLLDMSVTATSAMVAGTIFAEDVEYVEVTDSSTGATSWKYRLKGEQVVSTSNWKNEREALLQTHHYTCFSTTATECTQARFYYMVRDNNNYYAPLKNGLLLDDLLNIEFDGGSTNTKKSNVHKAVETWYINNLNSYTPYIEDTVYCNDRSLYQPWSNTTSVANTNDAKTHFGAKSRVAYTDNGKVTDVCPYVADSFTVDEANGNGALDYPVGLITFDEAALAGFAWGYGTTDNYLYNGGKVWWSMSPGFISATGVYIGCIYSTLDHVAVNYIGSKDANGFYSAGGVRPVISLSHNVTLSGGNGTVDNPFTIEELILDIEE